MSREDAITQAKQARRRQQLLDQALRECVGRVAQFEAGWNAKRQGDPYRAHLLHGDYRAEEKQMLHDLAVDVEALLDQGANIDTMAAGLDAEQKPVGMQRVVNHFLADPKTTPLAASLAQRGATLDQCTLRLLADAALRRGKSITHTIRVPKQAPPWFSAILDQALATPGLDWQESVEDAYLAGGIPIGIVGLQQKGRPIRIQKAIARLVEGFEDRLQEIQLARGEATGLPPLPLEIMPQKATWMLYEILSDGRGVEKLERPDKLTRVQQLLQAGANPMERQEKHLLAEQRCCAMDLACKGLDGEIVALLLAVGAKPSSTHTQIAVQGALERITQRTMVSLIQQSEEAVLRCCRALCEVLTVLDGYGVVDLDATVQWNKGASGLLDRHTHASMRAALEQHLPPFLAMFQPQQEARLLDAATPDATAPAASRRL